MSILSCMIILLNIVFCDRGTSSGTIFGSENELSEGVAVIKNVTRKEGESVSFICDVENQGSGGVVVVWRRGYTVISTGHILLSRDTRLSVGHTGHLHIAAVRHNDTGEYVCQVTSMTGAVLEQVHSLHVVVPAVIAAEQSRLTAKLGDMLTLRCSAHGVPQPSVHWYKSVGSLSGDISCGGGCLTISRVTLAVGGDYICSASNGVGHPAHANIHVNVLFGPTVTRSEAVILNTGRRDNSVRLTCEVSGSPSPVLAWYRGEALVQTSARHVVTREDVGGHVSRHVLSLLAVTDVDYGNYSCLATNTVGSDRSYIELHGRPSPPEFSEARDGNYLAWSVSSRDPVDKYRVLIRQENTTAWLSETIPGDVDEKNFIQNMVWVMKNVSDSAKYDCIVQAHNRHGWSLPSNIYTYKHDQGRENPSKSWMMSVFSGSGTQSLLAPSYCSLTTLVFFLSSWIIL